MKIFGDANAPVRTGILYTAIENDAVRWAGNIPLVPGNTAGIFTGFSRNPVR